jgi:hypothetical protein
MPPETRREPGVGSPALVDDQQTAPTGTDYHPPEAEQVTADDHAAAVLRADWLAEWEVGR